MDYIKCTIPKEKCDLRKKNGSCKLRVVCQPIIEKCEGCEKIDNGYCVTYMRPEVKWSNNRICPVATHIETEAQKKKKIRVGQQKHKKGW